MNNNTDWNACAVDQFWTEVAYAEHILQVYEDDAMLIKTLADYALDGFYAGDSVIVIATAAHHAQLNRLFKRLALNPAPLIAAGQFIPLDAAETLAKFMIGDEPDERFFMETIYDVVKKARRNSRNVRAFGEMVALLWDQGMTGATIKLEQLWNKFCKAETISLFCAYPKKGFTNDADAAMHICVEHTRLVDADPGDPAQIHYKKVV